MPRFLVTLYLLVSATAFAQTILTYAGGDDIFTSAGQQATTVQIGQPDGVAVDGHGNVYLSSKGLAMVLKVAPSGVVTVFAGNGLAGSGNYAGPAVGASLAIPAGLAFDQAGNLYIADSGASVVRRVDTSGTISTVAGTGAGGYSGDGG